MPTDIERVAALPRRQDRDLVTLAARLTERLCSRPPPFTLYPEQALALVEAYQCRGLVVSAPVGSGKSLIMYLAPTVLDAQRPLLVVPAHLREKTTREWRDYASAGWDVRRAVVKTYTEISRDKDAQGQSRLLQHLRPDVIICDEAHHIGNLGSGVTRKMRRFLTANPKTRFVALTGTLFKSTLMDGWHLCLHALRDQSPLPVRESVARHWSRCVDPGLDAAQRYSAAQNVGLTVLGAGDPRDVIHDRIVATPGFITSGAKHSGPLVVRHTSVDVSPRCVDAINAAGAGVRPDGLPLDTFARLGIEADYPGAADATTRTLFARWRMQQTLFLGYWDKPHPDPPPQWAIARARWSQYVTEILTDSGVYDTPEAVAIAVEGRQLGGAAERSLLREWQTQRDSYTYSTRPVWVDREAPALQYAAQWLRAHPRGLVWAPSETAGARVCTLAGVDPATHYYGAGQGHGGSPVIEMHDGPAVLGFSANKSGRNLQFKWSDNLFLLTPSLSGEHEQAIGRTHRPGQTETVTVEYLRGIEAHDRAWQAALDNARFVSGVSGDTPKILLATS